MTKQKSTKRALLMSALALLMCVSMLIGSTFAWFTDSVTSGNNIIKSGTLDVTMEWKDATTTGAQKTYKDASQGAIFDYDKWEPGYVEAKNIKIGNNGTLALKYALNILANGEVSILADVIDVYFAEGEYTLESRDLTKLTNVGTLADILKKMPSNTSGDLLAGESDTVTIALKMQETAGNEYQGLSIGSDFTVQLLATQLAYESDSFGNDYDKGVEVNNETLKEALSATDKTIVVSLTENVTYDVAAWAANGMGGADTETIIINGNGYTITFNQTNSDWNNVVTNGAKLVINNANITNAGHNDGPWNRHDINFACDVELNNVVSDKALAFKAGATLNNVTIDDANTSDTYAIWIQPKGQTVTLNGCVIDMNDCTDGRGIKIDEQYVSNPAKVSLNVSDTIFKTEEKAAILVKSVAGADIVLDDVNISGVATDSVNAVWVDSASADYANLVTVTGGTVIVEPSIASVSGDEALNDALKSNEDNIFVSLSDDVTYDVAAWAANGMGGANTKTIVINGNGNTITFNQTNSDWNNVVTNGAKLVINNANITNAGHNDGPWNRHDINFACDVELNNVVSDKALAFKAGATLNNVTIDDANTSDTYAIWIQPKGQTVTLNGCVIDMNDCTDGRGIKIDEQYVSNPAKVSLNVSDTTFKTEEKAAILVKSAAGANIVLSNVDISGVAADTTNAVWVDSASVTYYDLVTVTGGTKIQEQ